MLAGHYSAAFAGKAAVRTVPLWVLVFAVQLVDVAWSILVLLGIEKVRIEPGFMEASAFDLYHMPYTHSLEASVVWAVAAGVVYALLARPGARLAGGLIVAAAVFSHWLLDLIVHTKDLPILLKDTKVGFGLWTSLPATLGVELGLLAAGFWAYMAVTKPASAAGRYTPFVLMGVLVMFQLYVLFTPPPASVAQLAFMALTTYLLATGLAFWVDRTRAAK